MFKNFIRESKRLSNSNQSKEVPIAVITFDMILKTNAIVAGKYMIDEYVRSSKTDMSVILKRIFSHLNITY
jgi:hypothetical protein